MAGISGYFNHHIQEIPKISCLRRPTSVRYNPIIWNNRLWNPIPRKLLELDFLSGVRLLAGHVTCAVWRSTEGALHFESPILLLTHKRQRSFQILFPVYFWYFYFRPARDSTFRQPFFLRTVHSNFKCDKNLPFLRLLSGELCELFSQENVMHACQEITLFKIVQVFFLYYRTMNGWLDGPEPSQQSAHFLLTMKRQCNYMHTPIKHIIRETTKYHCNDLYAWNLQIWNICKLDSRIQQFICWYHNF